MDKIIRLFRYLIFAEREAFVVDEEKKKKCLKKIKQRHSRGRKK